jgi:hypothetical protein
LIIVQSMGHVKLTAAELKQAAQETVAARVQGKQ